MKIFTSESVTEGHPDKVCDQISDAILDAVLKKDPEGRTAIETFATAKKLIIAGEITTKTKIDYEKIARNTLKKIGYSKKFFYDPEKITIEIQIHEQSPDIAQGINDDEHEQGAGDQGIMFGYACDETPELMPLPIMLAHKLGIKLSDVRKSGEILGPDGKTQVSVAYENGKPTHITTIVIANQHIEEATNQDIHTLIMNKVIEPVCGDLLKETKILINGTGKFVLGGPAADTGLTGRKIIVDTYGGRGRHGGGAFSGKDPSKVDRSAAYMARHIAKNIVAAELANECEVELGYCIGVAEPVSLWINTFGTSKFDEDKIESAVKEIFPLKPKEIIEYLKLKKPIYQITSAYGHFGRKAEKDNFTWEKTNKAKELKKFFA